MYKVIYKSMISDHYSFSKKHEFLINKKKIVFLQMIKLDYIV